MPKIEFSFSSGVREAADPCGWVHREFDGSQVVELKIDQYRVIMPVLNGWRCALCGLLMPGPLRECKCGAMVATSGEVLP